MSLIVPLLLTTDSPVTTHPNATEFQATLMRQFFAHITDQYRFQISLGRPNSDVCRTKPPQWQPWAGITCVDGIVQSIRYGDKFFGNLQMDYVPNSVEDLSIVLCNQKYALSTRQLPRCLKTLDMSRNRLLGTLDCTNLPPALKSLLVPRNALAGVIDLSYLPKTLGCIDVSDNHIEAVVMLRESGDGMRELYCRNNAIKENVMLEPFFVRHVRVDFSGNAMTKVVDSAGNTLVNGRRN